MQMFDCEQGSQAWFDLRCGRPTASKFNKIVTSKGEPSDQRKAYLYQLAGEAVAGAMEKSYQSADMQRGIIMEEEARNLYTVVHEKVTKAGFCLADGPYKYGCSPDGLVGEAGVLEIKCPKASTHVKYLLVNKLPAEYFQQTQGQLLVTGREWIDFCSYYPGIKPLIIRVTPDEKFLSALRVELSVFCQELQDIIDKIK